MKFAAKGTLFQTEIAAVPGTYQTVAQIRNIGGPGLQQDALDVSFLDSVGAYRQFVGGFNDPGEIGIELMFDPTDATQDDVGVDGLLSIYDLHEVVGFQVVWPDATIWRFQGLVTAYEPSAPVDDVLTAAITVKLSGQPTFAAV